MTEKRQINLRLDQNLINKLQRQAEIEHRSTNNMIEHMIITYIENAAKQTLICENK